VTSGLGFGGFAAKLGHYQNQIRPLNRNGGRGGAFCDGAGPRHRFGKLDRPQSIPLGWGRFLWNGGLAHALATINLHDSPQAEPATSDPLKVRGGAGRVIGPSRASALGALLPEQREPAEYSRTIVVGLRFWRSGL
jgi:hypothetical protein